MKMATLKERRLDDLAIWEKIPPLLTAAELGVPEAEWAVFCERMAKRLAAESADVAAELVINIDGAARGNPGPAAIGVVIKDRADNVIREMHRRIGIATNNVAEYQALLAALDLALELKGRALHIRTDSELMARQINGQYRVKNTQLLKLYHIAVEKLHHFEHWHIEHVPRQKNRRADQLANLALDGPE